MLDLYYDETLINHLLNSPQKPDTVKVQDILAKAREAKGLDVLEAAALLAIEKEEDLELLLRTAGEVKQSVYGKRIVLFAPLYLSNVCVNNCLYCGFRKDNIKLRKKSLKDTEILAEAGALAAQGHKRLLLVCGEARRKSELERLCHTIRAIYKTLDIRRINVNIAPMTRDEFAVLKDAGIGTYQMFQETYHRPSYEYYHPSGPKSNYQWRISAFDRAIQAGIDDVGLGVLLGLYDYRFEVLALLGHAQYLEKEYGAGPHTVSVPRIQPARGAVVEHYPWKLTDRDFKKVVAVIRLALPYTGIILSTRESVKLRNELLHIGVSQISAGSSVSPGGYARETDDDGQFNVADHRSLDEVVRCICEAGYLPSFCTACYRRSRTGERFMALAKTGEIKEMCQPNALLTFKENLIDFASASTRKAGEKIISQALSEMSDGVRRLVGDKLGMISHGSRDIYF